MNKKNTVTKQIIIRKIKKNVTMIKKKITHENLIELVNGKNIKINEKKYLDVDFIDEDFIAVKNRNKNWSIIKPNGKQINDGEYDAILGYEFSVCRVKNIDGTWSLLNKKGDVITKNKYKYIGYFFNENYKLAEVITLDGEFKSIDLNGNEC